MNNYKILTFLAMMLALTFMVSATCDTTLVTNSTDFLQINTSDYREIPMEIDQVFVAFTFFTPRTNQTKTVYENIAGQNANTNYTIQWKIVSDTYAVVNASFVLKNGTNVIPITNYTISSTDNHTFILTFKDSRYNTTTLLASFNRTFVKNVDDIYLNATGMSGLAAFSTFIQSNSPSDYGDSKLFRPNPTTYYGAGINLSDWSVGWTYNSVDCGSTCEKSINTTLLNVILTMFIIGMLVFLGASIIYGEANTKTVVMIVVTFVILLVAMVILKNILAGVCVV